MLLADTATISISVEAAGTLAVGIAGGLAAAARIIIGFFQGEVNASREERRESIRTVSALERAILKLTARLERIEEQHEGHPQSPQEKS